MDGRIVDAVMAKMDELLLNRDQNVWRDACEIHRIGIAHQILSTAIEAGLGREKSDE